MIRDAGKSRVESWAVVVSVANGVKVLNAYRSLIEQFD